MRYLKLTLAYDGTDYVGWQVQPNGVSVQQRLEEAWAQTTQEHVRIVASGRTDSGVHAMGQVCSVATTTQLNCNTLIRALNANTPDDISIVEAAEIKNEFHAIRDASRKTYRYQIQFGRIRNPLTIRDHWFCPYALNLDAMEQAARFIEGEHDFASFQAAGAERMSTVRNVSCLELNFSQQGLFQYLYIDATSNGFLYNMVRNIVGTLVRVGQGSETAPWVMDVLQKKDRSHAGPTAPAHGLVLMSVEYDGIEIINDVE